MRKRLILVVMMLGLGGMALASAFADLSGKWTGKITTPDGGSLQINYLFKVDGDKLTGTGQGDGDPTAIDSGIMKGNDFTFSISNPEGQVFRHSGTFYPQGDSVGITIDVRGNKLHATLTRQAN